MRILVTGGSGQVGRRIVQRLGRDHEVVNLDLKRPAGNPTVVTSSDMSDAGSTDVPAGAPDADSTHVPAGTTDTGSIHDPKHAAASDSTHVPADILDIESTRAIMPGIDAVVHAAAIPGPSFGTPDDIYLTNIEGTRRVAQAAFEARVRRFVNVSSEAVLGLAFGRGKVKPRYFPIDEDHTLSPQDPYGRSKSAAEEALGDCRPDEAVAVSLRPPWVWVPEEYAQCRRLTHDPASWVGGLWAYVHGDDLALAVECALTKELPPGHYPVYVSAHDNGTIFRTRELLERYYPHVPIRAGIPEFGSLISGARAAQLIGFEPTLTWRGFLS